MVSTVVDSIVVDGFGFDVVFMGLIVVTFEIVLELLDDVVVMGFTGVDFAVEDEF